MLKTIVNALKGKSMTLNFNVLALALVVLDVVSGLDIVKTNPDIAMLITAVGNILLRFKTKEKVADK
jgi:hypothetical protein